jgi:hypothetical protein
MISAHPNSLCLRCKFFDGWCALGILDRDMRPLIDGVRCYSYEPKGCRGCD